MKEKATKRNQLSKAHTDSIVAQMKKTIQELHKAFFQNFR